MKGGSSNTDNCPLAQAFSSGGNCRDTSQAANTRYYPQVTGDKARCVSGDYYWSGWVRRSGTRCVNAKCINGGSSVELDLGNGITATCYRGQKSVDLTGMEGTNGEKVNGSLDCPNTDRMCISLQQEYFDNPKRFPYEDVTEAQTISDDQTGLSAYGIRLKRESQNGNSAVFDTNKLAAGFAEILEKIFGSGNIVADGFTSIREGVFVTGRSGSDDDLVDNAMESFRSKWRISDKTTKYVAGKLKKLISNTPRIGDSGNDKPNEAAEPETKPRRTKVQLIAIVEKNMIKAINDGGYNTNGWVGEDAKTMCSKAIRSVDLGSDVDTYLQAFRSAYRSVWKYSWASHYEKQFVGFFEKAIKQSL